MATKIVDGVVCELTAEDLAEIAGYEAVFVAQAAERLQADILTRVQERLDTFAKTRGYDDIKSVVGYCGCTVVKFATEAAYCRDKRAETWAAMYALLDQVTAGNWPTDGARQQPTGYADIEPYLPDLVWPTT